MTPSSEFPPFTTTIISNVDPFAFPFDNTDARLSVAEARWHTLWGSFSIMHVQDNEPSPEMAAQEITTCEDFWHEECRGNPVLANFEAILKNYRVHQKGPNDMSFNEESERGSLLELARGYYEEIWQSLTVHEQLALFHLSRDRFIHVEHAGLTPLLQKGLIRFDPDLRLLNSSFREFVRYVGERDELEKHETQQGDSTWTSLKWPLGLGFGTIILGLIMTQEELRTALPAVLTLLPLLLQGIPDLSKPKGISS